jgi:hypothetical protein
MAMAELALAQVLLAGTRQPLASFAAPHTV